MTPTRLIALLLTCALLGAGALAHQGSATTTTVVQASSSTGGLSAGALYAAASPGVVDITAEGSSSGGKATGTGFVVDSAGHIVTASHVVDGASKVTVKFAGGATRTATVTGKDDATDVAVLKIDPSGLTLHPLKLASSSSLAVGSAVAAIGGAGS